MSQNIRKGLKYEEANYEWFLKTLDVSGLSLHRLIHGALAQDAMAQGASIVALSYIAAERTFTTYSDMADAKSLLESITRSFGARLGDKKIRVNTVSQSPTPTRAGRVSSISIKFMNLQICFPRLEIRPPRNAPTMWLRS